MAESAVPILPSRDLRETLAFYERLGFRNVGAPPEEWNYLIHERGAMELHFPRAAQRVRGGRRARELLPPRRRCRRGPRRVDRAGVELEPPFAAESGMREFELLDPSGNLLRVGSDPAAR